MSLADMLAVLRALALAPIAWAILSDHNDVALVIFVIAALTDALDGYIARRATSLTPHGSLLDPLADKVLVVGALVALSAAGRGWPVTVVTVCVAAREALVAFYRIGAYRRGIALPADTLGKAKTVAEMLGVALIIENGRPWAVLGAFVVGVAFLLGLAALPRYLRS